MKHYEASELILTTDHKIYHLGLSPGQLAEKVILVGDPNRVPMVSALFDKVELKVSNREIVTHTGSFGGSRISVVSTGMGPDNIDIVLTEIDALHNIDFKTRSPKSIHTPLSMVRLGTSGALQADIPVESFVASAFGLGIDGVLHFYKKTGRLFREDIAQAFIKQTLWPEILPRPYVVQAPAPLLSKLAGDMYPGITVTAAGFYGPQGRELRAELAFPDLNSRINSFSHDGIPVSNFEMETSALYGLGAILGHEVLTICVIIANRMARQFSRDYKPAMQRLIETVLARIATD